MQPQASQNSPVDAEQLIRAGQDDARRWRPVAGSSDPLTADTAHFDAPALKDALSLAGYQVTGAVRRGGQSVVLEAIQRSTRRTVAVKVFHSHGDSDRAGLRRFEHEAGVLTQLRHPNIVSVYDAGVCGDRRYLVMDFVDGRPIDEYVAACRLPLRDVLTLCATICDAVNAAHLKGVIHRDLKPANILVRESSYEGASVEPIVLDFGLAKRDPSFGETDSNSERSLRPALDSCAQSRQPAPDSLTETGRFVGSIAWASPEQAAGDNARIDIRTDVYSLGVILYQLLTGRFPYDVTGSMRDVLNRIVQSEPLALRGASASGRSSGNPGQRQMLPIDSEVKSIVLTCLSKEPLRRYQSAGDLARDIRCYLAGEAIEARRDSHWYVLRKTLRRHRVLATATGGWIVAATLFCVLAAQKASDYKQQNEVISLVASFTNADLRFALANPEEARDWLVARYDSHAAAAKDNHHLALTLRSITQEHLTWIGEHDTAVELARRTVEFARADFGEKREHVARALSFLVGRLMDARQFDSAFDAFEEEWRIRSARAEDQAAARYTYCNQKTNLCVDAERFDTALVTLDEADALARRCFAPSSLEYAEHLSGRGDQLHSMRRLDEAEQCLRQAVAIVRQLGGASAAAGFDRMLHSFGAQLIETRKFGEAEQVLREALDLSKVKYPPGNLNEYYKYITMASLGYAVAMQGRHTEAEPLILDGFVGFRPPPSLHMNEWRAEIAARIVQMYNDWDRAQPGAGHDQQAARWAEKLEELRSTP